MILKKAWAHSRRNFRLALLPVVLPIVYRTAHRFLTRRKEELEGSDASLPGNQHLRIVKKLYNVLPALLSSPLFILLPEGLRVHVALYFLSSFLYTFTRLKARPQVKFEDDCHGETKDVKERRKQRSGKEMLENWRDYLPPVWTVSMLANTCLLWTFIFEPHAFPSNYHDAFIDVRLFRRLRGCMLKRLFLSAALSEVFANIPDPRGRSANPRQHQPRQKYLVITSRVHRMRSAPPNASIMSEELHIRF